MKKTTKGAVAAAAAATLLVGGVGTLAYWTDDTTIGGTTITSGHLKLINNTCGDWKLDGGATFTTQKLVPGDSLTRSCTSTVDAVGTHLKASFVASSAALADATTALGRELTVTGEYQVNSGATGNGQTGVAVVNGDVVKSTITVSWPYNSTVAGNVNGRSNLSNVSTGLTSVLNDITITATQTHDAG